MLAQHFFHLTREDHPERYVQTYRQFMHSLISIFFSCKIRTNSIFFTLSMLAGWIQGLFFIRQGRIEGFVWRWIFIREGQSRLEWRRFFVRQRKSGLKRRWFFIRQGESRLQGQALDLTTGKKVDCSIDPPCHSTKIISLSLNLFDGIFSYM